MDENNNYGMDEIKFEGPKDAPELICMIHGWPDDLHLWDRLASELLSTNKYRVLRVTMPGYSDNEEIRKMAGVLDPNFHEVATMIANVIKQYQKSSEDKAILVIHDWGSVTGVQLQRLFPGLVKKMVIMDVGPTDTASPISLIFAGIFYQYQNILAYLLWRYMPIIGAPIGDWLHRFQLKRFTNNYDKKFGEYRNLNQSASAAYYYYHYQMNFWLDWIGIRKNPMAPSPKNKSMNPSVPTLFLFGTTGLGHAFQDWSKELQKRNDSDVVSIEGDHWFMLKSPNATNKAVLEWLNFDEKGGKFTPQFRSSL